jgi:hypothetical protein
MRYTIVFTLKGPLAGAVAVEWTDKAAPEGSGAGWQPCLRQADGRWRMASYGGAAHHLRGPGLWEGIAIRYRLEPAGPWSPISETRKAITIVAIEPEEPDEPATPPETRPRAPEAADWRLFSVRLANGTWTGVIATCDATLGVVDRVDWLGVNVANFPDEEALEPHYEPTRPFDLEGFSIPEGERWWLFQSKATIVHEREPGTMLYHIRFRYRLAGGSLLSPHATERRRVSEAALVAPELESGTPVEPVLVAPALLVAPSLSGTGTIGEAVTLDPGSWSGMPAPALAFQWLRDGVPIEGATATSYVPVAADDLGALACRVVASNAAGALEQVTEALTIRFAPPRIAVALEDGVADEFVLDRGPDPQLVDLATYFEGDNLRFAAEGAGAVIDDAGPARLSIPVSRPLSGERITVTASNSGGAVSVVFVVTVEDETEEEPPRRPEAADWDLFSVRLANGKWTGVIVTRDDGLGAVDRVDWLGVNAVNFPDEEALEPHYEPTRPFDLEGFTIPEGERWWLFQSKAAIVHEREPGTAMYQIRFRYRLAGGSLLSPHAAERRSVSEAQLRSRDSASAPDPQPSQGWRRMPIRSPEEAALGLPGGEASQHPHGVARDPRPGHHDTLIWGHDMGAVWHSTTPVPFWHNGRENLGLWCYMVQCVAIHPVTGDWYAIAGSAFEQGNRNLQGVYRKKAGASRWEHVLQIDRIGHWRWIHETITFDNQGRIYVALNRRQTNDFRSFTPYNGTNVSGNTIEEPGQIWRSASGDPGSWTQRGQNMMVLWGSGTHYHRFTGLRAHPQQTNTFYLSTWNGLWKSTDACVTWERLSGKNGLPNGIVRNICMNPNNGQQLYIAVSNTGTDAGIGVYYSGNGGSSWSQINTPSGAAISKIFASPIDFGTSSARLYLLCRRQNLRTSANNGASWQNCSTPGRPGSGAYTKAIQDGLNDWLGTILPHPTIKNNAFAFANSAPHRTENATDWVDAGFGFSGFAPAYGSSFDVNHANPKQMALGLYDVGWVQTTDDGESWVGARPQVPNPDDPSRLIHGSCYNIARLWSDNAMICSVGTQSLGQIIVRSTSPFNPTSYQYTSDTTLAGMSFLRRHPFDANVIYGQRRRSTNKGVSWQTYGNSQNFVCDMNLGNPDVIYGFQRDGQNSVIHRSTNRGASFSHLVTIPWPINWTDSRVVTFFSDPHDIGAFWCSSGSAPRDLARWSSSTGWKTDFGLPALVNSLVPGGLPNNAGGVTHVAVHPDNRNHVVVVFSYPGATFVLLTRNAWSSNPSWEDISGNTPVTPGPQVNFNPVTGEMFYLSNGVGNFRMPFPA